MHNQTISSNVITLRSELLWMDRLIRYRAYSQAKLLFEKGKGTDPDAVTEFEDIRSFATGLIDPPLPSAEESVYSDFLRHYLFDLPERAAILLSLFPHIFPGTLEQYANAEYYASAVSGLALKRSSSGQLLPTGETLLFILAGNDLELRMKLHYLFDREHPFFIHDLVTLGESDPDGSKLSGALKASRNLTDIVTHGYIR